ncbi:hypothetical protein J6590_034001 [Homalodisca vitripennis]|nr:hypothetical protein J6590_034001 [Homalodisca vitripennis]
MAATRVKCKGGGSIPSVFIVRPILGNKSPRTSCVAVAIVPLAAGLSRLHIGKSLSSLLYKPGSEEYIGRKQSGSQIFEKLEYSDLDNQRMRLYEVLSSEGEAQPHSPPRDPRATVHI